jgi:hypothetical protein
VVVFPFKVEGCDVSMPSLRLDPSWREHVTANLKKKKQKDKDKDTPESEPQLPRLTALTRDGFQK